MSFLASLPKPFFVLAPMDDVTDTVFRQLIADCAAPDFFVTEFVNVDGLHSVGRQALMHKLTFSPKEQPIVAQIWGKDPDNYKKTADELVGMGFAGVDINMGCPDKTIVKNGSCAALIENRDLALEIIKAVQEGVDGRLPVSVKTRLGFNEIDYSWHELLLRQNLNMLTIHGRTRKEMSKVPANWHAIERVRELRDKIAPKTLIVGNGDVTSKAHAEDLARTHSLDGIMIGRGIFDDPFAFANQSPWSSYTPKQKVALYAKHVELFIKTYSDGERGYAGLKKFAKVYINGFAGAKEIREQCMQAKNSVELLSLLQEY